MLSAAGSEWTAFDRHFVDYPDVVTFWLEVFLSLPTGSMDLTQSLDGQDSMRMQKVDEHSVQETGSIESNAEFSYIFDKQHGLIRK